MPRRKHQLDIAKIDQLRIHKGWALDDLARRAGVAAGTISNIMRGEGVIISTAKKLADTLKVELSSIVVEPGLIPPPQRQDDFPKKLDGYREVSFWVGTRGTDGALNLTQFEKFDETTDLPLFLDRLAKFAIKAGIQLDWATVTRFEPPAKDPKQHGFRPEFLRDDVYGCAMVTVVLPIDDWMRIKGNDLLADEDDDDDGEDIIGLLDAVVL